MDFGMDFGWFHGIYLIYTDLGAVVKDVHHSKDVPKLLQLSGLQHLRTEDWEAWHGDITDVFR